MPLDVDILRIIIRVLPTVLFLLTIILTAIVGFSRGYNKSLKSLAQRLILMAIFILLYILLVDNKAIDSFLLSVINVFLGENGLQNLLGVTRNCTCLQDVLVGYFAKMFESSPIIINIIEDSTKYIYALVSLVYHIVFALVLYVLYGFVNFIVSLIRFIFFNDRKYRKRERKAFYEGEIYYREKKGRIGGLVIGTLSGCIRGLIFLSLFGSLLYTLAGGDGTHKFERIEVENETVDMVLELYNEVSDYGNHGVYKVLNMAKDNQGVPVYLYISDFIMEGDYYEENLQGEDISCNINLRNELSVYTKLLRDSNNIFLKYCPEEYANVINGQSKDFNPFLAKLASDKDFQYEMKEAICGLNKSKFVINLSLSLLDSVANYLNEFGLLNGMDSNVVELMNILFKKGYYSHSIPYEIDYVNRYGELYISTYPFPYLKPSYIINRADLSVIIETAFYLLNYSESDPINMVMDFLPQVQRLSLFSPSKKNVLNPVFARVFAFVEESYLDYKEQARSKSTIEIGGNYQSINGYDIYDDDIDWICEIKSLLSIASSIKVIYGNLNFDKEVLDMILELYDSESPNYSANQGALNHIFSILDTSKVVNRVLSTRLIVHTLESSLVGITPSFTYPENIQYISYENNKGELYNFIKVIEFFASPKGKELLNSFTTLETFDQSILLELCDSLEETNEDGVVVLEYFINSALIRSLVSALIIDKCEDFLIVPDIVKLQDSNGNYLNIIQKEELAFVMKNIGRVLELISFDDDSDIMLKIDALIDEKEEDGSYVLDHFLESKLINYNISNILYKSIESLEMLTIPDYLKEGVQAWDESNEINHLVGALRVDGLDLSTFVSDEDVDYLNLLTGLTDDDLNQILRSDLIYYNVAGIVPKLDLGIKLIIPNIVYDGTTSPKVIKKSEIKKLITIVQDLLSDGPGIDQALLISKIFALEDVNENQFLSNEIICATIINYLVNEADLFGSDLELSNELRVNASETGILNYKNGSAWHSELKSFIFGAKTLGIIENGEIASNPQEVCMDYFAEVIENYDEKKADLEQIYKSQIISKAVSKTLIEALDDSLVTSVYDRKYNRDIVPFEEIDSMLTIVSQAGTDFENLSFDMIRERFDFETLNEATYQSYLLRAKITTILNDSIDMNLHCKSIDTLGVLIDKEITSLLHLLLESKIDLSNIQELEISTFKDYVNDLEEYFSYNVARLLSKEIFSLELNIPKSVVNFYSNSENIMKYSELSLFFELFERLNLKTIKEISEIDVGNILLPYLKNDEDFIDFICKSIVFRATLSTKIKLDSKTTALYVAETEAEKAYTINNSLVIIINEKSLAYFLRGIGSLIDDNYKITEESVYSLLGNDDFEPILENSSTLRILLSNYLHPLGANLPPIFDWPQASQINAYNVTSALLQVVNIYEIKDLYTMKSIINELTYNPFM